MGVRAVRELLVLALLLMGGLFPAQEAHAEVLPVEEQVRFADGLYARSLYTLALKEYLDVSRRPDPVEAMDRVLYRIGECYKRLDNPGAAERFYARVLREHPAGTYQERAAFRRAEVLLEQGRDEDALRLFEAFLEAQPSESLAPPAHYYFGDAARRTGRTEEAVSAYRRVLDDFPDSPFASYAALDLAGLYEGAPERSAERMDLYQRVAMDPATEQVGAEALFQLMDAHFQHADYERSARAYERLRKRYPSADRTRTAALQAAWAYHNTGRYADGAALAEAALADEDDVAHEAEWWYVLANCRRQLLRAEEARETYTHLIDQFPDNRWARVAAYERALLAFQRDEFEAVLEEADAMEPAEGVEQDMLWLLAESYAALGRADEAVQHYRLLIDADPDGPQAPKAMYRLGRVLQQREDYVQAARTQRELVDRFPDDAMAPEALFLAAYAMAKTDQLDAAVSDWERLVDAYPDHSLAEEARFQAGLAHRRAGRTEQAREAFAGLLAAHPASTFAVEALYWVGVMHQEAGQYAEAEHALRALLEKEPDAELGERARFRLALALQQQDKLAEAADWLQGLLDTATTVRDQLTPALLEWLATYRLEEEAFALAAAAAEHLIQRGATAAWQQIGWYLYGRSLLGQEQAAEAVSAFEEAVALDGATREGAEAAWEIGNHYIGRGQAADAVPYLEQAAALAADDALADVRARSYFLLARAAGLEEDWDRAARYYMTVSVLFDDEQWVPEALHRGARALEEAGRPAESEQAREELRERYPDHSWTP